LPFGAQAADTREANNDLVVVTLGTSAKTSDTQRAMRFTTIRPNGDMQGVDKEGNRWTFKSRVSRYQNIDTGKTCYGEEARNHCRVR